MDAFDEFDTTYRRSQVLNGVLMRRGHLSLARPNDPAEERAISDAEDVAFEVVRQYHEWLSGQSR